MNNVRYADDSVPIADNIEDLQKKMDDLNHVGAEYGLRISNS